ncbi:hypothetical protein MAR_003567, partial [Mya arenaria]
QDPRDACCQVLKCDAAQTFGTCQDKVNCQSYGNYVCGQQYEVWARENCGKFCGYCGGGTNPYLATAPPSGACVDAIPNCAQYDVSVCTDAQYRPWAVANCPKHCNMCGATGSGGEITGSGTAAPGTGTETGTGTGTGSGYVGY